MDSPSAPKAPDSEKLLAQQWGYNMDAFNKMLNASRPTQITPWGTQSWTNNRTFDQKGYDAALAKYNSGKAAWESSPGAKEPSGPVLIQDPDGGYSVPGAGAPAPLKQFSGQAPNKDSFYKDNWVFQQQFSPEQQKLFDKDNAVKLQLAQLLSGLGTQVGNATRNPLDPSKLPSRATNPFQFYQKGADAAYGAATRYLDPQMQRDQSGMEARLAEQGFVPGTPAYNQAMGQFMDAKNRAYGQAKDLATQFGANWGGRAFDQQNSTRNQALMEALTLRSRPLNELSALRSGTQVQMPNLPSTVGSPGLQAPDAMNAAYNQYNQQMQQYNADVSGNNQLLGGLMGAGLALAGLPSGSFLPTIFSGMMAGGGGGGGMPGGSGFKAPGGFSW